MILTLKNEKLTVKIDTLGAELISVVGRDGFEYIWSGEEWCEHAPLLFPICGRIKDGKYTYCGKEYFMKSHGFAKLCEFEVRESSDTYIKLILKDSEDTRRQYPFSFGLKAEYRLDGTNLLADFTVENTDKRTLPYMFGWHPGFNMEGDIPLNKFYIDFGNKTALGLHKLQNGPFINPKRDIFTIPEGKYFVNNAEIAKIDTYVLTDTDCYATLASDSAKHSVKLVWGENLPYLCVWKAPEEEARFICLEPWSNIPSDGIKNECFDDRIMSRLSPGKSETYSYVANFN